MKKLFKAPWWALLVTGASLACIVGSMIAVWTVDFDLNRVDPSWWAVCSVVLAIMGYACFVVVVLIGIILSVERVIREMRN